MSSVAGLGLMGVEIGDPDDPIMITSAVLDHAAVPGVVDLHQREDLELWSALHALAWHGAGRHPLGVLTGDKPDRKLIQGNRTWGTELTQLTINHIYPPTRPTPRDQLAQAHRFRDQLKQRVESDPATYPHLAGHAVTIHKNSAEVLPKKDGPLVDQIAEALKEDKGVLFLSHGPGPGDQGLYGTFGPFHVTVQAIPGITGTGVFVACDFEVRRSEAMAALAGRVADKDKPGNEILIITCGVPDEYGWVSASDHAIFRHLFMARESGANLLPKPPTHIRGILIHESPDAPGLILLNDTDDVPWLTPTSTVLTARPPGPLFRRP